MASKTEFQSARELGYDMAVEDICRRICPMNDEVQTIDDLEKHLREQATIQYTHGFEEGKKVARQEEFCQTIYNEGYKKGGDDQIARYRIGTVYANNQQIRDLEAIKKLVAANPKYSNEFKKGYCEAIDRYIGVIGFSHDVDKLAVKDTIEEQMRVARNRLEERYRKAVEERRIDHRAYTQIIACIEATYQELFMAGVNVGMGELVGPQRIHLNPET